MMAQQQASPVEPTLAELISLEQATRRLNLKPGRVRSVRAGAHASRIKGRGMAFEESRPYQPGDDMRTFDWIVTARTGKPHTKVFSEEKERPVVLWVDFRQSMFFATQGQFKSALAARTAAALAWTAHHARDRVGALLFSEERHIELRPAGGHRPVLRLLNQLQHYAHYRQQRPTLADVGAEQQVMDKALIRLHKVVHPGSLVVLMSDFRHLDEAHQRHIVDISRHNQVVLFHLYDRFEASLPPAGVYPVKNNGRLLSLNSRSGALSKHYRDVFAQRQQHLEELARTSRAMLYRLPTDTILPDFLNDNFGRKV